jgi:hypothetical protein
VITAAHVAAPLVPGDKIQFGDDLYAVKRTVLHPEGTAPRGRPPEVDLALVELAEPVTDITPVELYRGGAEMGLELFIVGFGDFGKPSTGLSHGNGVRRSVTNIVDDAGPRRIFMKFDAPPAGTEFEGVGAAGDSGGPALLVDDGKQYIAGVSSASMDGKPGQYGVTDVYTRVSAYLPWIDSVINANP